MPVSKATDWLFFGAVGYFQGLSFTTLGKALPLLVGNFTSCPILARSRISSGIRPGEAPCNVISILITIPHDSEKLS
ncbi:hypothetical protein BGK49_24165 [Shigella sp. FC1544]|nr:hypothetical protein BGK49_24165 [Shigella sp. FC1544]ODQ12028.1 hypothetical protein BGK52_24160 [Shigella sp. FC1056]